MVASYFSKLKVGIMHIITIRHSFVKEDIETAGFKQILLIRRRLSVLTILRWICRLLILRRLDI